MPEENVKVIPYMHKCMDCGSKVRVSRRTASHAARPKCFGCGSTRLEPIAKNSDNNNSETK